MPCPVGRVNLVLWRNMKNKIRILSLFSLFILTLLLVAPMSSCTSDDYAAAHLSDYEVPAFNEKKFQKVERFYRDYYVTDIPDAKTMAKNTAEIYFNNYHEKIDTGDTEKVTDALIHSYVSAIGDKYSVYRVPVAAEDHETETSGSFVGIGVTVIYDTESNIITVTEVNPGGGADGAGIRAGDKIVAVDGERVSDIGYDSAVRKIRGKEGTAVNITILRGDDELTVTAIRKTVVVKSVKYSINEDKIGYIDIDSFKANTFSQFKEAVDFMEDNGAVAIIYDLRGNGGGLLASVVDMLSYIAPDKTKIASFSNNYMPPKYDSNPHSLSLPSVILCNKGTASAAELFTSAMRDFDEEFGYFDVTTVGVTTYGKGIMQSTYQLGDGSSLTLTVAYYNPPSGENYHGVGITPDVTVEQTTTADSQLDAAYSEAFNLLYPTVTEQLKLLGVPAFNEEKFKDVEEIFNEYYVTDLPTANLTATGTAKIYFEEYHEKIDTGDVTAVTNAVLDAYVRTVADRYSVYRAPIEVEDHETAISGSIDGINVYFSFDEKTKIMTVTGVTANGGAHEAGIISGDIIVAVDGALVSEIGYAEARQRMRGEDGTTVNLTILRGEHEFSVTVTRKTVIIYSVKYSINADKIGYIDIDSFNGNTFCQFKEAIDFMEENGAVAIIYDLRNNSGGLLFPAVNMLSYISEKNTTIVSFTNNYSDPLKDTDSHSLKIPSVVLCNKRTASAAELFVSAMRDFDEEFGYFEVTTVGETTYGKGIMQATYPLSDGSSVTLTVSYYNPPSGENYHGVGITPDVTEESAGDQLAAAYEQAKLLIK